MARHNTHYPVKATSRLIMRRKVRRISWFIVGTTFGVFCASTLEPMLSSSPQTIAENETTRQVQPSIVAKAEIKTPVSAKPKAPEVLEIVQKTEEAKPVALELPKAAEKETATKETATLDVAQKDDGKKYPLSLELKVASGDTLITMLMNTGVSHDEAHNLLQATKKVYNPRRLGVGQRMTIELNKSTDYETPIISALTLPLSLTSSIKVIRNQNDRFSAKKVVTPLERRIVQASGTINSSLYQTATDAGIPPSMVGEIINAYSYDVDFQRDIRYGHAINVIYEQLQTPDGKPAGAGNLIYAKLTMKKHTLKVYRHVDKSGNDNYYNELGEAIQKSLLRTPINGARISSGYGRRKHPILGYSKMHRGIDFAAPRGTPIFAAGDGVVTYAGRKGSYGNYVKIRHTSKYSTAYAHVKKFARSVRSGRRVKQGQIIAYVGTTGRSTGPHLHYEILAYGKQTNPSRVKFKTGKTLKGRELARFKKTIGKVEAMLANPNASIDLAMAKSERGTKSNSN